ncbi:ATP-binding protein [Luteolibacter algae]|uniref:histidine kinase n=1 Tax=Luteolibacter algae TaxID=454151 RepID=A0ABW5DBI9_9BACT
MYSSSFRKISLLVIEDNDDHWYLLNRHLSRSQQPWVEEIIRVPTFEEGREQLKSGSFDVVILDLNLPDSDSAWTIFHGGEIFERLPTIVLTSLEDEKLGETAIRLGAQDFISKDAINAEIIRKTVRHSIERFKVQQELKQRNEDLRLFGKTLAHEIRNPLHIVSLTLEIVASTLRKIPDQDRLEEQIARASRNTENISNVITELLSSALSSEDGKVFPVSLEAVIADALSELEEENGPSFTHTVSLAKGEVMANPQTLKQVFSNIFSNSIRYRDFDRPIHLEVKSEHVKISSAATRIYIRDNGVGICPDDLPMIFKPMFRARSTADRDGTGLGLYFCKNAIERMGGSIDVISKPGVGTTFVIDLLDAKPSEK